MATIPLTQTGPTNGGNFECHWQGRFLQAHILTDVGKKRERNEDSCAMCAPEDDDTASNFGQLFMVADGMGGVHGGEFASRLALSTLIDEYFDGAAGNVPERLRMAVERANQRIYEEAEHNSDYHGMGTTVSAVLVRGDYAYIAQVGDSRVYVKRGNTNVVQLTQDHSLVAEQVRNGIISEEEARHHSMKNLITRAVGTKDTVKIDLFALRIQKDDTFLICSDGLSGVVTDEQIDEALDQANTKGSARILVGKALEGGGPDNISVIVLRVSGEPPASDLHEGAKQLRLNSGGFLGRLWKRISA